MAFEERDEVGELAPLVKGDHSEGSSGCTGSVPWTGWTGWRGGSPAASQLSERYSGLTLIKLLSQASDGQQA
jgi:hypothetical protein